jgi:hypothetical protein
MCCGSKRSAMRNSPISAKPRVPASPGPVWVPAADSASARPGLAILRYREATAVRVHGPVTGRTYDFSSAQPAQPVDPRDAAVLMRSGLFDRE